MDLLHRREDLAFCYFFVRTFQLDIVSYGKIGRFHVDQIRHQIIEHEAGLAVLSDLDSVGARLPSQLSGHIMKLEQIAEFSIIDHLFIEVDADDIIIASLTYRLLEQGPDGRRE